jgi:flagellin
MSNLSINTNLTAINAQRTLQQSSRSLQDSLEQLSSGLRINSASDDPAGLAISQKMTAQIRGQSQSTRNLQDGLSMLQTAAGGAQAIESNLQRVRELSVQASNATLTDSDRAAIQEEVSQRQEEIDRIAEQTQFNRKNLLNGDISESEGGIDIQAGPNEGQTVNLSVGDLSTSSLGVDSVDLSTVSGSQDALESVDDAIEQVTSEQSKIGAASNRFTEAIDVNSASEVNLSASRSKIRDASLATASMERASASIRTQSGTAVLSQANQLNRSSALQLLS